MMDALTNKYARFLAKCPYIPIILTFVLLVVLSVVSIKYQPLPEFSDANKGFEARGTYISKATLTLDRLGQAMVQRTLVYDPDVSSVAQRVGVSEDQLHEFLHELANDAGDGGADYLDDSGDGGAYYLDDFGDGRADYFDDSGDYLDDSGDGGADYAGDGVHNLDDQAEGGPGEDDDSDGDGKDGKDEDGVEDDSLKQRKRRNSQSIALETPEHEANLGSIDDDTLNQRRKTRTMKNNPMREEMTNQNIKVLQQSLNDATQLPPSSLSATPKDKYDSSDLRQRRRRNVLGELMKDNKVSDSRLNADTAPNHRQSLRRGRQQDESRSREKRQNDWSGDESCCHYGDAWCLMRQPVFVFEPVNKQRDLFTVEAMHSMCHFQDDLLNPSPTDGQQQCEAKSMATIISALSRKHCRDITQVDMDNTKNLLETCGKFVHDNLTSVEMKQVPGSCSVNMHYVKDMLVNVAEVGFFDPKTEKIGRLEFAAVYLFSFYYDTTDSLEFYLKYFEGKVIQDDNVKITAAKFKNHYFVKSMLHERYIVSDALYFGLAIGLVFVIMFLYLRSIVLMLTTLLNVIVSLVTAYFIYHFVCRMTFFTYLNILAGLVLIAVGADDMFIFYDCWEHAKNEAVQGSHPNSVIPIWQILEKTLRHAVLSVFVTSFTTSAAFFANALSNITAIQDFAIFAGICILVNLFYMITLTPSVIVCIEWFYRLYLKSPGFQKLDAKVNKFTTKLHKLSVIIFDRIFPYIIDKTWFLWIFLLFMQGIGACIVVFVYPKLQLPNSKEFQLFPSSNIIENWDLKMTTKFQSVLNYEEYSTFPIQFYYLFGIIAEDLGNRLDPDDKALDMPPTLDPAFDIHDSDTQVFLYNLCHEVLKQPFMPAFIVPITCQFDAILDLLKIYCSNSNFRVMGCCPKNMTVPFDAKLIDKCAAAYQLLLKRNSSLNILGNFVFNPNTSTVKAYSMKVTTKYIPTFAHDQLAEYNGQIKGFLDQQLATGPKTVNNGFIAYTYWFSIYDLQLALANGTFVSILLSLAVAGIVMLVTSRNLLISAYAMLTICFAITCTVAVLVFLGWKLNITESLIISVAVGLSIDFTIHFGVAYRLSGARTSIHSSEPDHSSASDRTSVCFSVSSSASNPVSLGLDPVRTSVHSSPSDPARTSASDLVHSSTSDPVDPSVNSSTSDLAGSSASARDRTSALRTHEAFRTVGAAVAMAALTTFLAGVAVMPCRILVYIQLGIFLMLVMAFSWLYSNFFFMSLCHIVGPSQQCHARCTKCCAGSEACDRVMGCLGTGGVGGDGDGDLITRL